jgi:hypothetical protein
VLYRRMCTCQRKLHRTASQLPSPTSAVSTTVALWTDASIGSHALVSGYVTSVVNEDLSACCTRRRSLAPSGGAQALPRGRQVETHTEALSARRRLQPMAPLN